MAVRIVMVGRWLAGYSHDTTTAPVTGGDEQFVVHHDAKHAIIHFYIFILFTHNTLQSIQFTSLIASCVLFAESEVFSHLQQRDGVISLAGLKKQQGKYKKGCSFWKNFGSLWVL